MDNQTNAACSGKLLRFPLAVKTPEYNPGLRFCSRGLWTTWSKSFDRSKRAMATLLSSAVVDTTFVDIYVDTKNIPTCRCNIQHIDKRTMEKFMSIIM